LSLEDALKNWTCWVHGVDEFPVDDLAAADTLSGPVVVANAEGDYVLTKSFDGVHQVAHMDGENASWSSNVSVNANVNVDGHDHPSQERSHNDVKTMDERA
jgi:hypothetical protein